ncbi:ATP-binding protein [Ruminococcaceae bacterium OttesenSCG-928-O06]|nr:ATP-binding protein [Ruminococcaceae bacterium OttesenSCG-928-O06]
MQELSMNILDIAENSVRADASLVEIALIQDSASGMQSLVVRDDGKGMDEEMVRRVTDPFTTTRTTRKVGLGLPFLQMAARQTGGDLSIQSTPGVGTTVTASFTMGHIDLAPLGDMGGTLAALVQSGEEIDFLFTFEKDGRKFVFDTREARRMLDGVPLGTPAVVQFIKEHVNEGIQEVLAGE